MVLQIILNLQFLFHVLHFYKYCQLYVLLYPNIIFIILYLSDLPFFFISYFPLKFLSLYRPQFSVHSFNSLICIRYSNEAGTILDTRNIQVNIMNVPSATHDTITLQEQLLTMLYEVTIASLRYYYKYSGLKHSCISSVLYQRFRHNVTQLGSLFRVSLDQNQIIIMLIFNPEALIKIPFSRSFIFLTEFSY